MKRALICSLAGTLACSFPDVTYETSDGGDASFTDAPASHEGGDAGGPDADPCDRDHDTYLAKTCEGGTDCDDDDNRAHPGADFITDIPTKVTNGDWNCNGTVEKQYPAVNCGLVSSNCSGAAGFAIDEGCGATGGYVQCAGTGICSATDAGSRTQGCR